MASTYRGCGSSSLLEGDLQPEATSPTSSSLLLGTTTFGRFNILARTTSLVCFSVINFFSFCSLGLTSFAYLLLSLVVTFRRLLLSSSSAILTNTLLHHHSMGTHHKSPGGAGSGGLGGGSLGGGSLALFLLLVLAATRPILGNHRIQQHEANNTTTTSGSSGVKPMLFKNTTFPKHDRNTIVNTHFPFYTNHTTTFTTITDASAAFRTNASSMLLGQASSTTTASTFRSVLIDQATHIATQIQDSYHRLRNGWSSSLSSSSSEEDTLRTMLRRTTLGGQVDGLFDYIIVGAGASGSPLAKTLAEVGKHVLLIERGKYRTRETTPHAMDIYGTGLAIKDREISQLLITKQGIRSHIGTVMGGGTSINMGILIDETNEFFKHVEDTYTDVQWDMDIVRDSYAWITRHMASPMPFIQPYGDAWKEGLVSRGLNPNNGYDSAGQPEVTPSDILIPNNIWQGMSVFNSSDEFHRIASDELLGIPNHPVDPAPPTLTVLPNHAVQKVDFERSSGGRSRAVCVSYRETLEEDVETIDSRRGSMLGTSPPDWSTWLKKIFDPLFFLHYLLKSVNPMRPQATQQACVRPGGEIILSAGAILTPTILYKSGVGPADQVEELGLDLVHEIPLLGQNFSDRVLIPVGMFRKGEEPPQGFPTRICQAIGLKLEGPKCDEYSIGDRTYYCSVLPNEELGGVHVGENVIYSTRFIFAPEFRNEALMEYIFNVIVACAEGRYPYNSVVMASACVLAQPIIDCFKRVVANFYFTAEPKSRGTIKMTRDGEIIVDPNYMKEETDLFDAIRGVSGLISTVNSDVYRGIMEESGRDSCPVIILNGFLDILLQISADLRSYVNNNWSKFEKIQKHISDLIPPPLRSARHSPDRTMTAQEVKQAEAIRQELLKILPQEAKVEEKSFSFGRKKAASRRLEQDAKLRGELEKLFAGAEDAGVENEADVELEEDPFEYLEGLFRSIEEVGDVGSASRELPMEGKGWNGKAVSSNWMHHRSPDQWVASYPPTLPDPKRPQDVAKYVLSYMTSIWHFTGSAPMGAVVDNEFRVKGIDGLSIVDASVLNKVTRMNPTSTLLMLGRYAGLKKLKKRP